MPFNVVQGDSVEFTVEFLDASGILTVPVSGSLTVVYTNTAGSTDSLTTTLTPSGSFFTGLWNSGLSRLGFATWSVTAPGSLFTPANTGQLRVITP